MTTDRYGQFRDRPATRAAVLPVLPHLHVSENTMKAVVVALVVLLVASIAVVAGMNTLPG